jgi:glycosyltransferase involved in cell wall biosynthesis
MKLALLVEYYPPSRTSAAVQMADLATALARHGHEVTVFTTSSEVTSPSFRKEAGGVTVLRVPTGKVKGIGLVRRAISEMLIPFDLWRAARRLAIPARDFEGIVWYSPTIFLAPFVAWLKRRSGGCAYLILRDIFPQWAVDAGVMKRGAAYYFFKCVELYQYQVADVIGVQSPGNVEHFVVEGRVPSNMEVLFNWIDLRRAEPAASDLLTRHRIAGKRVVVYGGNMGIAQDVDNLLRLAENIRSYDEIRLLLVGSGTEVERLRRALVERDLTNVVLADEVPPEEFRSVLRLCEIGLISLDRRLTTHNIPGKLLTYLEAGLPIVASMNPGNDLFGILAHSGAGIGVLNGHDTALAEAVANLIQDRARHASMSENARALARERFDVEAIQRQLTASLSVRRPRA